MLEIKTQMIKSRILGDIPEYHLFDGEKHLCDARSLESLALGAEEHGVYIKHWFVTAPQMYENILDVERYQQAIIDNVKERNVFVQKLDGIMVFMSHDVISMFIPEYKDYINIGLYDALLNYTKHNLYFRVSRYQNGGKERFEFEAKWGVGFDAPYIDDYDMKSSVLVCVNDKYYNVIEEIIKGE